MMSDYSQMYDYLLGIDDGDPIPNFASEAQLDQFVNVWAFVTLKGISRIQDAAHLLEFYAEAKKYLDEEEDRSSRKYKDYRLITKFVQTLLKAETEPGSKRFLTSLATLMNIPIPPFVDDDES